MDDELRAYNHLLVSTQDIDNVQDDSKFLDFEPRAVVSEALGPVWTNV